MLKHVRCIVAAILMVTGVLSMPIVSSAQSIPTISPWYYFGGRTQAIRTVSTSTQVVVGANTTSTASLLETPSITVTGQASEGCAQFDATGVLTSTGILCGTGGGGGGASSEWLINGGNLYVTSTPSISSVVIGQTSSTTIPASPGIILNKAGTAVFSSSVGIATRAPSTTLHVVGTFRTSGTNTFDGAINASSTFTNSAATILGSTLQVGGASTFLAGLTGTTATFSGAVRASSTLEVTAGAAFSASTTMQTLPASRVVVTDANLNLAGSVVTGTELSYVSGVTSAIQTQLDGKQASGSYALQATTISAGGLLTGGGDLSTNRTITFASSSLNLGTMSIQNANSVAITGGTITGITDLAIADGGTATSTTPADAQLLVGQASTYRLLTATAGTGITIATSTSAITFTNSGVTSIVAGSGISIDQATGAVTITNTGGAGGGSVSTSTPITQFTFPFWQTTAGGLNGSSSIYYSAGNIGIAHPAPSSTLHVVGTFQATGAATFGTSVILNSDTITDFTGTGLQVSGGALQATLGTSVDLTTEVTGVLPIANGGTATSTTPTDLQILVGNNTNYSLRALTAGSNITISTSTTAVTITASAAATTTSTQQLEIFDSVTTNLNPAGNQAVFQNLHYLGVNKFFREQVLMLGQSTSSKPTADDGIYFTKRIPPNWNGVSSSLELTFTSASTTGNVVFDFGYRCVGTGESLDQTSYQQEASTTIAMPGTVFTKQVGSISMTASNCVPGDDLQGFFGILRSDAAYTAAAPLLKTLNINYEANN